ncbi:MAG: DUF2784 domain-containing protein [Gammaproteobacteria bacterium]|nr:DUF2784 domain-containing protein [Gammaproteobacteria bacterium]MCW8909234.1 DUF2784 domain-containing protein [Gammaproteobacteria bacterium]MCW9004019.1 DUF2784 domain-containing protein [Gammaproteobacteria bacterium]MCW9055092.1 DUF2784 domain-containing protein [Gammaproteobacteria bacterium]
MKYQLAADFIVILHFAFIVFVIGGAFLVFRWRWIIWLHIPAVIWGAVIEISGWICPLTPVENSLRKAAGAEFYSADFIEHYLLPVIYPAGFSHEVFTVIGVALILINVILYTIYFVYRKDNSRSKILKAKNKKHT